MNKILLGLLIIVLSMGADAQFKIEGKIDNYQNKDLLVRIFTGANDRLVNKLKTNNTGEFSVNIPENYSGLVRFENSLTGAAIDILTDNENVKFNAKLIDNSFDEVHILEGKTAQGFMDYKAYVRFQSLKMNLFPTLKSNYDSNDEFYKAIEREEIRIEGLNPDSQQPLVKYFAAVNELALTQVDGIPAAQEQKKNILNHLVNDNEYLEGTGFLPQFVLDYLRFSIYGISDENDRNNALIQGIDELLDKTDLETPRGQNALSSVFLVLPKEQFGSILERYYDRAEALTCEITEELKADLFAHKNTVKGTEVPNIVFQKPVKGFKSLYEVKADKKLIVFWASWCPACQQEMPFIKEYYKNFKAEGGEIVAISLDFDESEYNEAVKDFEWINYTELLRWDTQGVREFGVESSPTIFLVDKDNKLIKKGAHISEFFEF